MHIRSTKSRFKLFTNLNRVFFRHPCLLTYHRDKLPDDKQLYANLQNNPGKNPRQQIICEDAPAFGQLFEFVYGPGLGDIEHSKEHKARRSDGPDLPGRGRSQGQKRAGQKRYRLARKLVGDNFAGIVFQ